MTDQQINFFQASELGRHNLATEKQARKELRELKRHQRATETETHRSNVANETNFLLNLDELSRHNKATETETNRSNIANEQLKKYAADLGLTQAQINAASRIQAAGLSADAAIAVASLTTHSNAVISNLNRLSNEEIARLNREMNSVMQQYSLGSTLDRLDLDRLRLDVQQNQWLWEMLYKLGTDVGDKAVDLGKTSYLYGM